MFKTNTMTGNLGDSPGFGLVGFWSQRRVDGYHTRVDQLVARALQGHGVFSV